MLVPGVLVAVALPSQRWPLLTCANVNFGAASDTLKGPLCTVGDTGWRNTDR